MESVTGIKFGQKYQGGVMLSAVTGKYRAAEPSSALNPASGDQMQYVLISVIHLHLLITVFNHVV